MVLRVSLLKATVSVHFLEAGVVGIDAVSLFPFVSAGAILSGSVACASLASMMAWMRAVRNRNLHGGMSP